MLVVAGGICVLMAFVPGFPSLVFLALALVAGGCGVLLTPSLRDRLRRARHPAVRGLVRRLDVPATVQATALPPARPSVALLLRLPAPLLAGDDSSALTRRLEEMLDEFQLDLGLTLPRVHLHGLPGDDARWELLAYEVPIAQGRLPAGAAAETLAEPVRQALSRHTALFLGIQDTTNLLTRASADAPDVVKEVLRALPLQRVADVLRRLVGEAVSIRNLRDILEALADAGQRDKDAHALTEFARVALRRQISHQVAPDGRLGAVMLEPGLEELLRQAVRVSGGVAQLALEPDAARRIAAALAASIGRHRPQALITAIDVRWHLRKLIEPECHDTPVLSYHELMPTLQLDVLDRVADPGVPRLQAA